MRRNGMTLMELLTVVSILATLAALLFPVFVSVRSRPDLIVCADQLRQIGVALKIYAHDYGDDTPYGMPPLLEALFPNYVHHRDTLVCPTFRKAAFELVEDTRRLAKEWLWSDYYCWASYWIWEPRSIDKRAKTDPFVWISFAEVYAKRGDQIPVADCSVHLFGAPDSSLWRYSSKRHLFNPRSLANPNAPLIVLRWSGQVNFVHTKTRDWQVFLLTH